MLDCYNTIWYTGQCQRIDRILSPSEMSTVTSYWSTQLLEKRELNRYQREAIDLVWDCEFSMIQGPPGLYSCMMKYLDKDQNYVYIIL